MDGNAYLEVHPVDLDMDVDAIAHPRFERPLQAGVREARLLGTPPWVRSLGKLAMDVKTEGWRFPAPPQETAVVKPRLHEPDEASERETASKDKRCTRL